ncbi:hypothetical protein SBA6_1230024 [Candidatus Sulfopaludibacter sp. SbA6]|nr:hypothetical protein SBA6_1230024 [Candidatus Sulfopaludibacter sp. SbA6]
MSGFTAPSGQIVRALPIGHVGTRNRKLNCGLGTRGKDNKRPIAPAFRPQGSRRLEFVSRNFVRTGRRLLVPGWVEAARATWGAKSLPDLNVADRYAPTGVLGAGRME